jgi:hypothetical protein
MTMRCISDGSPTSIATRNLTWKSGLPGLGRSLSEQRRASWTVGYDITYQATLVTARRGMPPVTRMKASALIGHDASAIFSDGMYTLQTDGETVHLQKLLGEWHVVSLL